MARRKKSAARAKPAAAAAAPAPAAAAHDAEVARVRALLELMREHGLLELEIGPDGQSVRLSKTAGAPIAMPMAAPMVVAPPAGAAAAAPPSAAPVAAQGGGSAGGAAAASRPAGDKFLSPMVGTFYRAPSPEAKPFVMEGDVVKADSVLCIIEAMKVLNEIKAEKAGKVIQILVENGEAVEYDQPLFVIQPS
jgi:acetyl-CoA carboxylase biotin carboxyl carrier protein